MSFIFKIFWKIVDIAFFPPTRICTAFPEAILLCSECLPYSFLWWISSLLVFCSMCYFMTFTRTPYLICCQEENFTSSLKKRAASRNQQTVIASYSADGISEVRLSEFKFQPHTLLKSVCASCKGARLGILLLPFPPDLLPPPPLVSCSSFLHELLSFPPADNESCCLWCQGEPGGGNNGAETKCQPQCTRMFLCVFPVCVCDCVSACVSLLTGY